MTAIGMERQPRRLVIDQFTMKQLRSWELHGLPQFCQSVNEHNYWSNR